MQALTMDYPLTLTHILRRTQRIFGSSTITTKTATGLHRYTFAEFYERCCRLGNVLRELGVQPGERVGTFAWNTYRHLEVYFATPCSGAVVHTVNIRLSPSDIAFIINHAEDKVIFVDETLIEALESVRDQLKQVRAFIVMGDGPLPSTSLAPVYRYEDLLSAASSDYDWPALDERSACGMCYTSGTTGNPKGVVYSHRGIFLHSLAQTSAAVFGISERDTVLPVVPMFHVNAWGLPYSSALVGANLVLPGQYLQPPDLASLIEEERVSVAAGVPTVWIGLLAYLKQQPHDVSSLRLMPVGGSAVPPSLMEEFDRLGARIVQAWGMTEMSPIGTVAHLRREMDKASEAERMAVRAKQGFAVPGVELRAVDESGSEAPWDGQTLGELQVRGPWITSGYYNDDRNADAFMDGWFRTGDVVTIDRNGYIQIADRTKDLVKSGGEWISSVDLELAIMGHPDVLEAAVIAVPHERWQERPIACVVAKPDAGSTLTAEGILDHLRPKFARWWLPDAVLFVDAIPKTSVGKFDKKVLREQFKNLRLESAPGASG